MSALDQSVKTGVGCAFIVSLPFLAAWGAYATSMLWRWFAVPLGAPTITVWQAYGLGLLGFALTGYRYPKTSKKERDAMTGSDAIASALTPWLGPGIMLGLGYVCRWWLS